MGQVHGVWVRPVDRRQFLRTAGAAALGLSAFGSLLALSGCGAKGGARVGGQIDFLSWEGYDLLKETEAWRKENGIEMKSGYIGTSDDVQTKLLSPGGRGIDLTTYYHGFAPLYRELGIVSEIKPEEVPEVANLHPTFRDGPFWKNENGAYSGIPFTWGATCLNYRPDMMQPPGSWLDLFDSTLKGKVAMTEDPTGNILLTAVILGFEQPSRLTPAQLEEVKTFLKKMKAQSKTIAPTFGDATNLLVSGEVSCVYTGWAAVNVWAGDQGVTVDCTIPKEGTYAFVDAYFVPKQADNRASALAFINHALSREVQAAQAVSLVAGTVRPDAVPLIDEKIRKLYPYDNLDSFFQKAGLYENPPHKSTEYAVYDDWIKAWEEVKAS